MQTANSSGTLYSMIKIVPKKKLEIQKVYVAKTQR